MREFEERLEVAIASLPPIYREALLLVGVEQLRPVDAAKVCGISPESLRKRLSRARGLISRFLGDQDPSMEVIGKEVIDETRP
jgi:DNA-directed RNA polymerase specialized sigma24 family protein